MQTGQATTQNPKLQGKPFYVRDRGVLALLDPYLTTTHKDHRAFKPDELKKYPKKDAATYWQCEDYPKAWGHGLKDKYVIFFFTHCLDMLSFNKFIYTVFLKGLYVRMCEISRFEMFLPS